MAVGDETRSGRVIATAQFLQRWHNHVCPAMPEAHSPWKRLRLSHAPHLSWRSWRGDRNGDNSLAISLLWLLSQRTHVRNNRGQRAICAGGPRVCVSHVSNKHPRCRLEWRVVERDGVRRTVVWRGWGRSRYHKSSSSAPLCRGRRRAVIADAGDICSRSTVFLAGFLVCDLAARGESSSSRDDRRDSRWGASCTHGAVEGLGVWSYRRPVCGASDAACALKAAELKRCAWRGYMMCWTSAVPRWMNRFC